MKTIKEKIESLKLKAHGDTLTKNQTPIQKNVDGELIDGEYSPEAGYIIGYNVAIDDVLELYDVDGMGSIEKLTTRQAAIISAYTGILLCDFDYVHEYIEEILGRVVSTDEIGTEKITSEIRRLSREDCAKISP